MQKYRNILFVVKDVEGDGRALDRAVKLARNNGARLSIAGLVPEVKNPLWTQRMRDAAGAIAGELEQRFAANIGAARDGGVEVRVLTLTGKPWAEVVAQVERDHHDLLVLAQSPEAGLRRMVFGNLILNLMRKCPCPVWVPNPAGRTCDRILVAIDPLEEQPTQRALNLDLLRTAGALARMDGAKLIVKTVVDVPGETFLASAHYRIPAHEILSHAEDLTRRATDALKELSREAGLDELRPELKVVTGNLPGDEIARTVHAEHIDLLVMGSVHRAGVAGLFMGNNAERILQQISCGVFTAKPTPHITLGG